MSINQKRRDVNSPYIPVITLAVTKHPMRFTEHLQLIEPSGYPALPGNHLGKRARYAAKRKISGELAVIMCQLMQYFSLPQYARVTLQSWQNSDEAIGLKRDVDSIVDFCGYLYWGPTLQKFAKYEDVWFVA